MTHSASAPLSRGRTIVQRLIYINLGMSLLLWLGSRLWSLLPLGFALESKFYFFPKIAILWEQPWRFVTYMWVHDGLMHLGVNMLVLWYVGQAFSARFGSRMMVSLYLLSGVGGSLFYLLFYQAQSLVGLNPSPYGLIGSSAAILGLLFGYAFYDMELTVRVPALDRDLKMWQVVSLLTLLHALLLRQNLGGIGAHIGGVGTGLLFAWMLRSRGVDITRWLSVAMDHAVSLWEKYFPRADGQRIGRGRSPSDSVQGEEQRIDPRILNKIRSSGYASLNEEEQKQLKRPE